MKLFDMHCDTITLMKEKDGELYESPQTHVDIKRSELLNRWIQIFAIFIPDSRRGDLAAAYYDENLSFFNSELSKNKTRIKQIKTRQDLAGVDEYGRAGAILSVEGGCILAGKPENIEKLKNDGVRALTLTWNGHNEIASGFDTGEGISDFGRAAIAKLEEACIAVDLSHINDIGFWQVAEIAQKPFFASHSGLRKICASKRNLTDEQFKHITKIGGVAGVNFYTRFLNDDHFMADAEDIYRHISHALYLGGTDSIALGSDFDGSEVPEEINSIDKISILYEIFLQRGFEYQLIEKIMYKNAFDYFEKMLPESGGTENELS